MSFETASPTFAAMPSTARVWVFGAAELPADAGVSTLLHTVDAYLSRWKAHGTPLVSGRVWQHNRFLVVAVDEAATGASGCSIDGLFRVLSDLETDIGTSLVDRGRIYWRDGSHTVVAGSRSEFQQAYRDGVITAATPVFDTTVSTIGEWQLRFERPVSESWHARLVARLV